MLKRLLILNSDIYSKADIDLNNCDSLQIVGPNNIGKSTLIYALNFLYIIDLKLMTFSGNRSGDKSTINHYFPTINSSYIVFEIFKKRYYCILIKKNAEGGLDYYKIDSDYKEEHYFDQTHMGQKLKKIDSLLANLSSCAVQYNRYSNRRDIFNFVYQKGKRNNGVVWLGEGASMDQREISNNFSKIYRYLINSKLIDNKALKESLIIADNKENEHAEFSKKHQKDIQTLHKHNKEIQAMRSIEKNFADFKELVDKYKAKDQIISQVVYAFNKLYITQNSDLNKKFQLKRKQRVELQTTLLESLVPKQSHLNQKIGGLKIEISQITSSISEQKNIIERIKSYEGVFFLNESFINLDKERKKIESQITQIEDQNLNSNDLSSKHLELIQNISQLNKQIEAYSNLLIHQISSNKQTKELLNAILSEAITSLPSENIHKGIQEVKSIMNIFDGEIFIPNNIQPRPIDSIEDLQVRLDNVIKEKKIIEDLIPIAKDLEKYKSELSKVQLKIKIVNKKLEEINLLPELEKNLANKVEQQKALILSKDKSEMQLNETELKIRELDSFINTLASEISHTEIRIKEIQKWKLNIEQKGITPLEGTLNQSLDDLYSKFEYAFVEKENLKNIKARLFENLKLKIEKSFASEQDLITYLDLELATLDDKQKSIETLLKNISTQFSIPSKTLYSKFQEFQAFINNQFNSKIRKIKISDIDSLKVEIIPNENLINDLKKIMEIRDLSSELIFDDQSENLYILNKYLDNQSLVCFKDLFDIKLHLEKKGKHKVVDLRNQIESDGTDKMIRLVIIMSIIHQIIINDSENKIVLFVDEMGTIDESNRIELLDFCKQNNFIPISAAPIYPYSGFDKYYLVRRSQGKIVVSEKNGNVIYSEQQ